MNREDIIGWMQEVGAKKSDPTPQNYDGFVDIFQRFAALVAAAERKACVIACEKISESLYSYDNITEGRAAQDCANAIRARGER